MLKGAIIGFGKITQSNHIKAFADERLKSKLTITSAVEPNLENKIKCEKEYPFIKFYSSVDELFENEKIDFVDITAPPKFHGQLIRKAVENKVNIICEKPFALTLEEAADLSDLLKKSNLVFIPCHQYRFSPIWQRFKNSADSLSSKTKALLQFNVFRMQADEGLPLFQPEWRTDKSLSGGGILADTGVHYLYLCNWLLGKPLSVLAKTLNLNHPEYSVEDTALVIIEFPNAVAQISITWSADRRVNSARFITNKFSLNYEGGSKLIEYNIDGEKSLSVPDASDKSQYVSYYTDLFEEFYLRIKSGNYQPDFIDEAFNSILLLNKCYRSSEQGKTIKL